MMIKPRRVLLETTSTLETRFTTGIQRVVRSIVGEAGACAESLTVESLPIILRAGRFFHAEKAWRRKTGRRPIANFCDPRRFSRTLGRWSPKAARSYHSALVRLRKLFYPKTVVRKLSETYWTACGQEVSFSGNDVLLLLDESWGRPLWPAVEEAKHRGCSVGAVVYDLIPLDYPEFFNDRFVRAFNGWLQELVRQADFFITISRSVAARLREYVDSVPGLPDAAEKRIAHFHLGTDIPQTTASGPVYPRVQRVFAAEPSRAPYLAVGTVEPRKNHAYLLDAFDQVWARQPDARLCIVGRIGWKCGDILSRIENHALFGKNLFLLNDLSDTELRFCYQHAKALITASHAEGFGLPIVEGLFHGRRVLASDIPIHREVGGEACTYFDLADPGSLAGWVIQWEQGGTVSPRGEAANGGASNRGLTTWDESCRELLATVVDLDSHRNPACPRPGAVFSRSLPTSV